jgi:hypothetical protein
MNWRPKALGVVTATAALLCMSATGAAADRPTKTSFTDSFEFTNTSLCGFEIEVGVELSGFETSFLDEAGGVVRTQIHITEQDTFSANGVTLVGKEYRLNVRVLRVDGEVVEAVSSGVLEKVRLPDGSTFMAAGRTDLFAATVDFVVEPDNGVSKNLDAFCDALSG